MISACARDAFRSSIRSVAATPRPTVVVPGANVCVVAPTRRTRGSSAAGRVPAKIVGRSSSDSNFVSASAHAGGGGGIPAGSATGTASRTSFVGAVLTRRGRRCQHLLHDDAKLVQMLLERMRQDVEPVLAAQEILEVVLRLNILNPDGHDHHPATDGALDLAQNLRRLVRLQREEQHHHPRLGQGTNDRAAPARAGWDVARRNPATDAVRLEPGAHRVGDVPIGRRVADEDVVGPRVVPRQWTASRRRDAKPSQPNRLASYHAPSRR